MKVLHVSDFLPGLHNRVGGAEFVAQRIIQEQMAAGTVVDVATLVADNAIPDPGWGTHYQYRNLDRYAPRFAYAVKQLFVPSDPLAARGLLQAILHSKPDVIHFHNLHFSGLSVLGMAHKAGIPAVWSIYDYWLFCPSFMLLTNTGRLCTQGQSRRCVDCVGSKRLRMLRPVKGLLFQLRKFFFTPPLRAVDRFVVLSSASGQLLEQHGIARQQIEVIPQYIWNEAADAAIDIAPVPGRLVYVGWVEARKGLHVVVAAFIRLAEEFPDLHIEVLGLPANAAYQTALEAALQNAGVSERVNFRGKLSRAAVLGELKKAFLVMVPEQWENMSPVILTEAMAAGTCVLASRVGGIKQFVENGVTGLVAERDDVEEWARQIRWAMEHPQQICAMRPVIKARARQLFNTLEINARMATMYSTLVNQPRERKVT